MSKGSRLQYGSYKLFPIWEKFCRHVVDAYGENDKKTLIRAYELANGLPPTPDKKVRQKRYDKASEWMKNSEIRGRCEEIERELNQERTMSRERIITRNINILEGDPLISMKENPETGMYVWKRLNEIPKFWRKLVVPTPVRGRMVYILDKKAAEQRIIDLCGYDSPKHLNIHSDGSTTGELRIGFSDGDDSPFDEDDD